MARELAETPTAALIVGRAIYHAAMRAAAKPKARDRLEAELVDSVQRLEKWSVALPIGSKNPQATADAYGEASAILRRLVNVPAEIVDLNERRATPSAPV